MQDYPHWNVLPAADRLRLAALEAELAGVDPILIETICDAADLLEAAEKPTAQKLLAAEERL